MATGPQQPGDRADQLREQVRGAMARLADELAAGQTEGYRALLTYYSRFHAYSLRNCLLIRAQRPDATRVAGMSLWNELGYRVRAGERAIWIWSPLLKKERDEATGEEREGVTGFRPAPVFDASQLANLDERPLPTLWRALPDDVEDLYQRLRRTVELNGIKVVERPLPPGVQGASLGGTVILRPRLDSRNRIFALLHEVAHEVAHWGKEEPRPPRARREFEAESVAYIAAAVLGLEHPTARDYLLSYRATPQLLNASFLTIQRLVGLVLPLVGVATEEKRHRA